MVLEAAVVGAEVGDLEGYVTGAIEGGVEGFLRLTGVDRLRSGGCSQWGGVSEEGGGGEKVREGRRVRERKERRVGSLTFPWTALARGCGR